MNCRAAFFSTRRSHRRNLSAWTFLLVFAASSLRADVDIGLGGELYSGPTGPRYVLTWDGVASAVYGVQANSNLLDATPWRAVDLARPTNGAARWIAPEALSDLRFFRVAPPQPEIFSVEPAVFAPGTAMNLFVLGQFFATGDAVYVDGTSLGAATFLDHTTLQSSLPPMGAGTHTVEVFRAGGLLSSFVVVCASAATSPELVLQEPPELPPAAPVPAWLSKRGYDYYKNRSDLGSAGAQNNPFFNESQNAGSIPDMCVAPSGQLELHAVDLAVAGRSMDFVWARTYRSRTGPTNSTMGTRWSHSYDVWCVTSATEVVVADGTGRREVLRKQPNGTFTAPGLFREGVATNTGFRLTFADSGYWEFEAPPGGSSAGRLVLVAFRDRAGNTSTCGYDGAGRLSQVVDDLGRTNRIAYDPDGRIASVTDFLGRSVTYSYYRGLPSDAGAPGDLASVTSPPVTGTPNTNDFPTGKTTTFTYSHGFPNDVENHLALSIVDPLGQTAAEFTHEHNPASPDYLSCVSVLRGIDKKDIRRAVLVPSPANRFATVQVFHNDYVGNVTECFYDARLRPVLKREFTGHATPGEPVSAVSNRPTGKLRSTDPEYFETKWSWNNDSLCTRVVMPRGNAVECVYEADLNKGASPRKRGDLRVVREISGTGEPDLVTTYQHDPRFGSEPASRMRTRIKELEAVLKSMGLLARSSNPDVYIPLKRSRFVPSTGSDEALDFQPLGGDSVWHGTATTPDFEKVVTDPNGTVTLCDYDANGNRVKVKFPWLQGGDVDFGYDSFGGVTSVTHAADATGRRRVDAFALSNGLVVAQTVDAGPGGSNLTTMCYRDPAGNVSRVVDPNGNDWLFTYNSLDQCVLIETPINVGKRAATTRFYDANDNLVRVDEQVRDETDALVGTKSDTLAYDVRNRPTSIWRPVDALNSAPSAYAYDGNDNVVMAYGGEGALGLDPANAVAFEYDERGLLFREIRAPGSPHVATNTIAYTLNGHPATKQYVDASDTTAIAYDGFDRPVTMTDAMGNVVTCTYDACGNLRSKRTDGQANDVPGSVGNIRLAECFYDYDPAHRLLRTREAHFDPATQAPVGDGFRTTSTSYAPNGAVTAVSDDLGRVTSIAYDTAGRRASVWDPLSNRVEFAYDAGGNVVAETSRERSDLGGPEQVFVRTHAYDRLHRLTRSVDNAGNTNRWIYNSLGQCVKSVDPRGVATFHVFDYLGRLTMTVGDLDGDGQPSLADDFSERATWSTSNPARLLSTMDGNDNVTSFAYDALDRCTNTTFADGTRQKLIWSPKSNLVRQDDANGTVVLMTYDLNNRCTAKAITPGAGVATNTLAESFAYDGLSRLVGWSDADGDPPGYSAYDSLGNCVRESLKGLVTVSTYDSLGRRTAVTYPGGRSLTYARDLLGRCSSISESALALAINEFDGPDRIARISYANNMKTRIFYDGASGTTNLPGDLGWRQVAGIRHAVAGAQPIINDTAFAWDRSGNKIGRIERILPPALPRTNTLALRYDRQSRLTNAVLVAGSTQLRNTAYGFDRVGNRTNVTGATCAGPYQMDASALGPQDAAMNQYTATPCDSRTYDENGNLNSMAGSGALTTYSFDYANRLVGITRGGSQLVAFAYDPLGRRISKTTFPSSLPPVTTLYVYDGNDIIEERNGTNVVASYVHPANGGIERPGPFSMRRSGADYYLHADDQGSVVAVTDTNAVCVERYLYDDYGAVTFLTGDGISNSVSSSVIGNPYLFHGMQFEPASQLHFTDDRNLLGLRDYNPSKDYLVGDCVIYNQSVYQADTGRALNRPAPNLPPIPGMCPGAMLNQPVGNNPWSTETGASTRSIVHRNILKSFFATPSRRAASVRPLLDQPFATGSIPFQEDFWDLIDTLVQPPDDGLDEGPLYICPIQPRPALKDIFLDGGPVCAKVPRAVLKEYFEKGDKPTQAQFGTLIDSLVNMHDDGVLIGLRTAGRPKELTGHITLIK